MKIHYDKASDGLIIEFSDAKPKMSTTIGRDTVLHQSDSGQHMYLRQELSVSSQVTPYRGHTKPILNNFITHLTQTSE